MSDRLALRAAICANPDEDTPRLAYADWLDEHGGKGGAKRAAYIRGEIADHHTTGADTPANAFWGLADEYERTDWRVVDDDLRARVAAQKAAGKRRVRLTLKGEGVPSVKGVRYARVERGFFSCAWVEDAAAFLRHADAIFRAAPVTELVFEQLDAEQAADLVRSGHLTRVRGLKLRPPVDPEAVRVLGASRDAAGVRKLELSLTTNGTAALGALAAGAFWTGVEWFHATSYRSDSAAGAAGEAMTDLLAANPFPNLRELHAWASRVNDDGAKAVARNFPELRFADLAINDITGAGAAALAASKSLKHLRHLDLGTCDLEEDTTAGAALIVTNNLPNLTVLKLEGNHFRPAAKALARGVRGPTLRALGLNTATFTPASLEALAKCPATHGLWHLEVYIASIGDEHLERFTRHAAFDRLTTLDLSNNEITGRGAKALAAWSGAASLQWLDLSNNPIGAAGAQALAASPHLAGLKQVRFSGRGTGVMKKRFKKAFE